METFTAETHVMHFQGLMSDLQCWISQETIRDIACSNIGNVEFCIDKVQIDCFCQKVPIAPK